MKFHPSFLTVLLHVIILVDYSTAWYDAKLRFLKFLNPTGRDNGGSYCEGTRSGTCDTYFKLCVVLFPSTAPTSLANCVYSNDDTPDTEKHDIDFQVDNTGIRKTIPFHGIRWQNSIGFYMEIWDDDTLKDDLIDRHSYRRVLIPGVNGTSSIISDSTTGLRYRDKTTLQFTIQVYCTRNYYGASCTKYCLPQDNAQGHYKCDKDGNHVCLKNWYQLPKCLTYCAPSDDNINGHFTCDSNGTRICRKDWYGLPNCLKSCIPRDDDVYGHYTCDSAGSRVCRANWYNLPNCTKYCKEQDNAVNGHYSCDRVGNKLCHSDWYGSNCSVHCVPKNDSQGHYNCTKNGNKLCHTFWHGNDCDKFCKYRDDQLGHFNCSNDGDKICYDNYYGKNCSTFCLNNTEQYYCDQKTGNKICLGNWIGQFCNISKSVSSSADSTTNFIDITSSTNQPSTTSFERLETSVIILEPSEVSFLLSTVPHSTASQTKSARMFTSETLVMSTEVEAAIKSTTLLTTSDSSEHFDVAKTTSTRISVSSARASSFHSTGYVLSSTESFLQQTRTFTTNLKMSTNSRYYTTVDSLFSKKTTTLHTKSAVFSSIKASKSSTVVEKTKSKSVDKAVPTIEASKKNSNKPSGVHWLFNTKDGNVILGGSGVALFLLVASAIAIAMYFRSSKNDKISHKELKKPLDSCDDDMDDLMKNAHVNPLYIELEDAKEAGLHLTTHDDKRDKVFYEKKQSKHNNNHTMIHDYSEEDLGVVQNPLYGIGVQFVYNDDDETGV